MRLVLDALVVKADQAGLRSHAVGLGRALARVDGVELTVVSASGADVSIEGAEVRNVEADLPRNGPVQRAAWRARHMARLARDEGADAIITTTPELSRPGGVPHFVFVHDLGPAMAPGIYGRTRWLRYLLTLRRTLEGATGIFAVSNATKLDIVRWVGPEVADRITVVRNAGQELPRAGELPAAIRSLGRFALYVGAFLPHKNVETILRAFRDGGAGLPIVCVGPDYAGERETLLSRYEDPRWIVPLGFVPSEELSALYGEAQVVLFPSLFEGFGLPLLEASRHGGRVVASRLPAFEEVARGDVRFIDDPTSVEAWREATRAVVEGGPRDIAGPVVVDAVEYGWDDAARSVVVSVAASLSNATRSS